MTHISGELNIDVVRIISVDKRLTFDLNFILVNFLELSFDALDLIVIVECFADFLKLIDFVYIS